MNSAINLRPLMDRFGFEEALKKIKSAGFSVYELDLDILPEYYDCEGWRDLFKDMRAYADGMGMVCNQAHAPFPVAVKDDEEKNKELFESVVKSIERASILGAKIIVVHGAGHLYPFTHSAELREWNTDFFKRLIPYCEKFDIKVAVENVWDYKTNTKEIIPGFCGMVEDFNRYIDELNSPYIVGCADIGHIALIGADIYEWLTMAGKRIKALHIHDNDFVNDSHAPIFWGKIDFNKMINALKEIDYQGDLTLELFVGGIPEEMTDITLKYIYESVEYIKNQIKR